MPWEYLPDWTLTPWRLSAAGHSQLSQEGREEDVVFTVDIFCGFCREILTQWLIILSFANSLLLAGVCVFGEGKCESGVRTAEGITKNRLSNECLRLGVQLEYKV